jgi:hypothetical protein
VTAPGRRAAGIGFGAVPSPCRAAAAWVGNSAVAATAPGGARREYGGGTATEAGSARGGRGTERRPHRRGAGQRAPESAPTPVLARCAAGVGISAVIEAAATVRKRCRARQRVA